MKALKVIGILLLVVIGIGLIASLVLPKDMEITESVVIEAPMDVVWNNVSSWEKIDRWSPWYKDDPDMKVTFEGEPGTLASTTSWQGNKDVGSGSQSFTAIDPDSHIISTMVNIKEPWEGQGDATIALTDEGEGKTKVTWSFKTHQGVPGNLMGALFNAKGMLSEAYTRGLASLKEIAEEEFKNQPVLPTYQVRLEQRAAMKYAGNRELIKWDSMHNYFQTNMPKLAAAFEAEKMEMGGAPSALYWTWNEDTHDAEMTVAIPLKGDKAPKGYKVYDGPSGDVLVIDYYGDYDGTGAAHEAMEAYITQNGYESAGVVVEEYITDPVAEPDNSKWLTRIVYPVKKKDQPEQ